MPARAATPLDLRRVSALLARSLREPSGIMASALPVPLAAGAVSSWTRLLPGLRWSAWAHAGLPRGIPRTAAVERARLRRHRPEWVVLMLAAMLRATGRRRQRLPPPDRDERRCRARGDAPDLRRGAGRSARARDVLSERGSTRTRARPGTSPRNAVDGSRRPAPRAREAPAQRRARPLTASTR